MAWETEVATAIDADAEAVWTVLTDLGSYPEWNPTLTSVRGTVELGERLRVRVSLSGGPTIPLRPTVTVFDPGRELRWKSHPGPGSLFEFEHAFLLEPTANGCRFVQRGRFEGPLAAPLLGRFGDRIRRSFAEMNRALSRRAGRLGRA